MKSSSTPLLLSLTLLVHLTINHQCHVQAQDQRVVCYVCGGDPAATITNPNAQIDLALIGFPGEVYSCDFIYNQALDLLFFDSECAIFTSDTSFQTTCGCTNVAGTPVAPVPAPVPVPVPAPVPAPVPVPVPVPVAAPVPTVPTATVPVTAAPVIPSAPVVTPAPVAQAPSLRVPVSSSQRSGQSSDYSLSQQSVTAIQATPPSSKPTRRPRSQAQQQQYQLSKETEITSSSLEEQGEEHKPVDIPASSVSSGNEFKTQSSSSSTSSLTTATSSASRSSSGEIPALLTALDFSRLYQRSKYLIKEQHKA